MNFLTIYEVFGLLFTAGSALYAYLRSPESAKNQNTAFVSLVGVVFTMLMSIRYDLLPKIDNYLSVAQTVSKHPDLLEVATRLSQAPTPAKESLMAYMLNIRLKALENNFDLMAEGKFIVDESEMPDFALELMKRAHKRVFCTSYVQFNDWWNTRWGAKYETLNEDDVKHGVRITRIFIFSSPDAYRTAEKYMAKQERAGMDVKYAMANDLKVKLTSDMIVIDDQLAGELRLTPDKGLKEAEFYTRQTDIDDVNNRLNSVDDQSSTFKLQASANSVDRQE